VTAQQAAKQQSRREMLGEKPLCWCRGYRTATTTEFAATTVGGIIDGVA
jgi:hypothetical protein